MDLKLTGKLAVVTGSTRGIGRAIAERLIQEGAHVIVNGRAAESTNRAAADLTRSDRLGRATGVAGDLSTSEGTARFLETVKSIGSVDIPVNNVGAFEMKSFADTSDSDWIAMFNLNLMSGVRLSRATGAGCSIAAKSIATPAVPADRLPPPWA
jgi:NAD(P)-dependent dehydrogenase (short-subunit alcohol dehydrogenase family)